MSFIHSYGSNRIKLAKQVEKKIKFKCDFQKRRIASAEKYQLSKGKNINLCHLINYVQTSDQFSSVKELSIRRNG